MEGLNSASRPKRRVKQSFLPYGGGRTVTGIHNSIIGQCQQFFVNALLQLCVVMTREKSGKGCANPPPEQCVAAEDNTVTPKTDTIRTVSRRIEHRKVQIVNINGIAVFQQYIRLDGQLKGNE